MLPEMSALWTRRLRHLLPVFSQLVLQILQHRFTRSAFRAYDVEITDLLFPIVEIRKARTLRERKALKLLP